MTETQTESAVIDKIVEYFSRYRDLENEDPLMHHCGEYFFDLFWGSVLLNKTIEIPQSKLGPMYESLDCTARQSHHLITQAIIDFLKWNRSKSQVEHLAKSGKIRWRLVDG